MSDLPWLPLYHCGNPWCRVWPCCVSGRRLGVDEIIRRWRDHEPELSRFIRDAERRARTAVGERLR